MQDKQNSVAIKSKSKKRFTVNAKDFEDGSTIPMAKRRAVSIKKQQQIKSKSNKRKSNKSSKHSRKERSDESGLNKNSGYITCLVCNQTKYYSHVQRRYGIFSCEPCFKFFSRFIKEPKHFQCKNEGRCKIVINDSNQSLNQSDDHSKNNTTGSRCKACWLKLCVEKFQINFDIRQSLVDKYCPKLCEDSKDEKPERRFQKSKEKVEVKKLGNKCFKNSLLLSKPETSESDESEALNSANALSVSINSTVENKNDISSDWLDSPLIDTQINEDQIRNSNPKSRDLQNFEFSNSPISFVQGENNDRSEKLMIYGMYENLKQVSNQDSSTSGYDSSKARTILINRNVTTDSTYRNNNKNPNIKKSRCKECEGCKAQDCGQCSYCLDKKKFGGSNVIKQACKYRVCIKFRGSIRRNQQGTTSDSIRSQSFDDAKSDSNMINFNETKETSVNFLPTPPSHSNSQHGSPNLLNTPSSNSHLSMLPTPSPSPQSAPPPPPPQPQPPTLSHNYLYQRFPSQFVKNNLNTMIPDDYYNSQHNYRTIENCSCSNQYENHHYNYATSNYNSQNSNLYCDSCNDCQFYTESTEMRPICSKNQMSYNVQDNYNYNQNNQRTNNWFSETGYQFQNGIHEFQDYQDLRFYSNHSYYPQTYSTNNQSQYNFNTQF